MDNQQREIINLLHEHESIRASLKWLEISVNDITARSPVSPERLKLLREKISNLLPLLDSLRHGIKDHADRDRRAIEPFADVTLLHHTDQDHKEIKNELDKAITQTELLIDEKWNERESLEYLSKLKSAVAQIYSMVDKHTREEDAFLIKTLPAGNFTLHPQRKNG